MASFFSIIKNNVKLILLLGLPYSTILLLSAFGPAMNRLVGTETGALLSTVFLFFLLIGMTVKIRLKIVWTKVFFIALIFLNTILYFLFRSAPFYLKVVFLVFNGLSLGRIAVIWSHLFYNYVKRPIEGRVISWSIFAAYLILYGGNVLFPVIEKNMIVIILALLLLITAIIYSRVPDPLPVKSHIPMEKKQKFPWFIYLVIFLIYLTAGFTYTRIYPYLLSFHKLERFYNVFPFVVTAPLIGSISDRYSSRHLLYLGIGFLGFGFIFLHGGNSAFTYFLIQSTLQPGWAFLDIFVWIIGVELAHKMKNPYYITYSVAVFLFGTALGSLISLLTVNSFTINLQVQIYMTLLPLFAAILLFSRSMKIAHSEDGVIPVYFSDKLTEREIEVVKHLLQNKNQKEICDNICISINTLKTHTRNIYRKLDIHSKKELRDLYGKLNSSGRETIEWM